MKKIYNVVIEYKGNQDEDSISFLESSILTKIKNAFIRIVYKGEASVIGIKPVLEKEDE